ncbi:glycoside hydrolase family 2 protein [Agromyces sp. Leaf222]|uniref:glycoside hydrolase family 2 protein n=1 Tax=Agromyces sp. Leaf222 TaxID=1735688 RepID=UPI00350EC631
MQGFDVRHDVELGYRVRLDLRPTAHHRIVLRFDGVYGFARVWVNGVLAGTHLGGFTRFEFDVTDLVRTDSPNLIAVGVTDQSESVSTASNYAFHPVGGILRPVSVVVLPRTHLAMLHVQTPIEDAGAGNARLELDLQIVGSGAEDGHLAERLQLRLRLTDPDGDEVYLGDAATVTPAPDGSARVVAAVPGARLWSDESPALYELELVVGSARYRQRIGFRDVRVDGHRLVVNDVPVMLRGINRHDIHPRLGRASDGTLEREDLERFRAANINFVRTSHYPPHPALLDAADELGIYVEVENGVCWAGQFGWPATQDDERFAPEYLGPLAEMIERDRNHPSVLIWSIGNESTWGENFRRSFELAVESDPSRPVIMSFAGGPEHVISSHYPAYGEDLGSTGRPVLHDEVVHLPVYQSGDLRRDPGIHADWAASLNDFMVRLYAADGGLGIAIWSGIDEQFALPGGTVGFGPWGILDIWRRRKPEWWAVRSAFSPVQFAFGSIREDGSDLEIPVVNHHSRTGLADFDLVWRRADGSEVRMPLPNVAPASAGAVRLRGALDGIGPLTLRVEGASGRIIDERTLELDDRDAGIDALPATGPAPSWSRDDARITITGRGFSIDIDARTGHLLSAVTGGRVVLSSGWEPWADGLQLEAWCADRVEASTEADDVVIRVDGTAGALAVTTTTRIDSAGIISVDYRLDAAPGALIGRSSELGLAMGLGPEPISTKWIASAPLGIAGDGFLGRSRGSAHREVSADRRAIGEEAPGWNAVASGAIDVSVPDSWSRDFRAGRSTVWNQTVTDASGAGIEYLGDGSQHTRLFPARRVIRPDNPDVSLSGAWEYREVAGGLNQGTVGLVDHRTDDAGATATVRFSGSAIDCLGALGPDLGVVDIELDGVEVASGVDLFSPVDCSGHTLFSAQDLNDGDHELTISVTGRSHRWSAGSAMRLQAFEVFAPRPDVQLAVLAERIYPVSGSFDWVDPAVSKTGADGVHASGSFRIRLLPGIA